MKAILTDEERKRKTQSLTRKCGDKRHALLQEFARIEMALTRSEKFTPFGHLLKSWIDEDISTRKRFEDLAANRNLIAHAYIEIVQTSAGPSSIWKAAKSAGASNARVMNGDELDAWCSDIQKKQRQLMQALDEA